MGARTTLVMFATLVLFGAGGCADAPEPADGPPTGSEAQVEPATPNEPADPVALAAASDVSFEAPEVAEAGALIATRSAVPLGALSFGEPIVEQITLLNPGPGDARIDGFEVTGAGLAVTLQGHQAVAGSSPAVAFPAPVVVRAGEMVGLQLIAPADQPGSFAATVSVDAGPEQAPIAIEVSGVVDLDEVVAVPATVGAPVVSMPDGAPALVPLTGAGSVSPGGAIVGYQWVALPEPGAAAEFMPNSRVAAPVLVITKPGAVDIRLTVIDQAGDASLLSKPLAVSATDDTAVAVEVVWEGPPGADLDVHLVHPLGAEMGADIDQDGDGDGWFDPHFDCWEDNPLTYWPTDSPDLVTTPTPTTDHVSRDGVILPLAQSQGAYPVGVHYVPGEDEKMALAVARVEVRVHGALVWQSPPVELAPGDLWAVGGVSYGAATFAAHESPVEHVVPTVDIP